MRHINHATAEIAIGDNVTDKQICDAIGKQVMIAYTLAALAKLVPSHSSLAKHLNERASQFLVHSLKLIATNHVVLETQLASMASALTPTPAPE